MFVTIEGIDGSGKSTVIDRLIPRLEGWYISSEPTQGYYGRKARKYINMGSAPEESLYRAWLFMLDRAQHARRIEFEIGRGKSALCDRYLDSTLVYSSVELHEARAEGFNDLSEGMCHLYHMHPPGIPIPDLTFVLMVDPDEAQRRVRARMGVSRYDKDKAFLARVQNAYSILATLAGHRIQLIEAMDKSPEHVARIILEEIQKAQMQVAEAAEAA